MLRLQKDRIFRFVGLMLIMLICFGGCAGIDSLVQEGRYDEAVKRAYHSDENKQALNFGKMPSDYIIERYYGKDSNPFVFEENFDDNRNDWHLISAYEVIREIKNGKFLVYNRDQEKIRNTGAIEVALSSNMRSLATKDHEDFIITFSIRLFSKKNDSIGYGVQWCASEGDMFYTFAISSSGCYVFYKQTEEDCEKDRFSFFQEWIDNDQIRKGCAENKVTLEKSGDIFHIYINGHLVKVFNVKIPPPRAIYLLSGNGTEIAADYIRVSYLPPLATMPIAEEYFQNKGDAEGLFRLAEIYLARNLLDDAKRCFLHSNDPARGYAKLVQAYRVKGNDHEAINLLREIKQWKTDIEAKFRVPLDSYTDSSETAQDGPFIANSENGTVLDTNTGLMWAAKDNGEDINWSDAKRYCENYRGGGYTDWRLPTQEELEGLYDKNKKTKHFHVTRLMELTACCPWASEIRGSEANLFVFDFGFKYISEQSHTRNSRALPVRSGRGAKNLFLELLSTVRIGMANNSLTGGVASDNNMDQISQKYMPFFEQLSAENPDNSYALMGMGICHAFAKDDDPYHKMNSGLGLFDMAIMFDPRPEYFLIRGAYKTCWWDPSNILVASGAAFVKIGKEPFIMADEGLEDLAIASEMDHSYRKIANKIQEDLKAFFKARVPAGATTKQMFKFVNGRLLLALSELAI